MEWESNFYGGANFRSRTCVAGLNGDEKMSQCNGALTSLRHKCHWTMNCS